MVDADLVDQDVIDTIFTDIDTSLFSFGATGSRPAAPDEGDQYVDTTLDAQIWYDGSAWRENYDKKNVLDEDNMASDSATEVASQQSIKAYVDARSSGKVLQVVSTTLTSTVSATVDTMTTIAGLTASITPADNTNKVLVMVHFNGGVRVSSGPENIQLQIDRGGTAIAIGDAADDRTRMTAMHGNADSGDRMQGTSSFTHLDSPATASSVIYAVQWKRAAAAGTMYCNRSVNDSDAANHGRYASSITLLEVDA